MRGVALVLVGLVLGTGLAATAAIAPPPEPESLVEGHTVFTVLEQVRRVDREEVEYAAAVAVLVRERFTEASSFRFPGVLWFNDQYLVDPVATSSSSSGYRHPCHGAVVAVNAGDPVPLRGTLASNDGATYVESYQLIDPNDVPWVVDRWSWTTGGVDVPLWTVAILGAESLQNTPDDGECDAPPHHDRQDLQPGMRIGGIDGRDPGHHGQGYPCGTEAAPCFSLQYNAVLYFLLADLTVPAGEKDHTEESADWLDDASGCHERPYTEWPCPGGDDDREGNSHAYNPVVPRRPPVQGAGHGGSGAGGAETHAMRRVDIHYGVAAPPAVPRVWRVTDLEGSTAPYHCHGDLWCGAGGLI